MDTKQKEVRDKMKENLSEEELAKVDDEIKRLDDAFTRLKPKVIPRIAEFVTDKDRWWKIQQYLIILNEDCR